MSKKALITAGITILLGVGALLVVLAFLPSPPKFHIKNSDSEPVKVIAHWRDKTKDVGEILPGSTVEFSVDDEAAMSFEIMRANGTAVRTGEIYFTSGVSTHVEITRTGVAFKSDVEAIP